MLKKCCKASLLSRTIRHHTAKALRETNAWKATYFRRFTLFLRLSTLLEQCMLALKALSWLEARICTAGRVLIVVVLKSAHIRGHLLTIWTRSKLTCGTKITFLFTEFIRISSLNHMPGQRRHLVSIWHNISYGNKVLASSGDIAKYTYYFKKLSRAGATNPINQQTQARAHVGRYPTSDRTGYFRLSGGARHMTAKG